VGWGVCDIGLQPAFLSFCFQEHLLCTLNPFLCRSGSISRGFRGEFKNWQITPGYCEMSPVMANQFSIFVTRGGNKKYASVLAPGQLDGLKKSSDDGISSWDWKLKGDRSTYHALFPRAWTVYDGNISYCF